MRSFRSAFVLTICSLAAPSAQAQPVVGGPGVDPTDFEITVFATGLNFPVGMTKLSDGSVLVAVSNGTGGFFSSSSGKLIRLVDSDDDGVADSQTVLFDPVPAGKLSAVRLGCDLVFTTGPAQTIAILRTGATPADSLTLAGTIDLTYPGGWGHPHSALIVRETPGQPGSCDLFFQVGSKANPDACWTAASPPGSST